MLIYSCPEPGSQVGLEEGVPFRTLHTWRTGSPGNRFICSNLSFSSFCYFTFTRASPSHTEVPLFASSLLTLFTVYAERGEKAW